MRHRNQEDTNLKMLCDILFSLFAFIYLYFFQRDLLGMMYGMLPAADLLPFSQLFVSLILTAIILFIGLQIRKLLRFKDMWYACNYLPSAFLLGLCTSCDKEHFINLTEGSWYIVLLLFVLVMGLLKVLSMIPQGRNNLMKWPYAILLLLLTFCVTLFIGNTDENLHRELKVSGLLEKGEPEKALQIGVKAEECTTELTLLRAKAMLQLPAAEAGSEIAERFFTYPVADPAIVADSLYALTDSVLLRKENANLMALLVDKELEEFVKYIDADSDSTIRLSLWYPNDAPRYYMEAMILYEYIYDTEVVNLKNLYPAQYNRVSEQFSKYVETKKEYYIYSEQNRRNRLYMSHGKTYWWYYDFY